jgi:hypothetical protein
MQELIAVGFPGTHRAAEVLRRCSRTFRDRVRALPLPLPPGDTLGAPTRPQ